MSETMRTQALEQMKSNFELDDYHHLDKKTVERFLLALLQRPRLISSDLPKEMGFDGDLVHIQKILDIAEEKNLVETLYKIFNTNNKLELIQKMLELPKDGPLGNTLGGKVIELEIDPMEMFSPIRSARAFFTISDNPEAVRRLKAALDKLGY
jgi:hypothetical protein